MQLGVLSHENLQLFDFDGARLSKKTLVDVSAKAVINLDP
jgi:hypothetical protein